MRARSIACFRRETTERDARARRFAGPRLERRTVPALLDAGAPTQIGEMSRSQGCLGDIRTA